MFQQEKYSFPQHFFQIFLRAVLHQKFHRQQYRQYFGKIHRYRHLRFQVYYWFPHYCICFPKSICNRQQQRVLPDIFRLPQRYFDKSHWFSHHRFLVQDGLSASYCYGYMLLPFLLSYQAVVVQRQRNLLPVQFPAKLSVQQFVLHRYFFQWQYQGHWFRQGQHWTPYR